MSTGGMNLVLLGPPGAGKGTQARLLAERCRVPGISTGDILRTAVRDATDLGRTARTYMDRGALVPDEVVVGIVEERLAAHDTCGGFILDGFPRTLAQARALDGFLADRKRPLRRVLHLAVEDADVVRRLSGRRTCPKCGAQYHVEFNPPPRRDVCGRCGAGLVQRDDDREETIRARLRVYREETEPLVEYYAQQGLLERVAATGPVEEVSRRMFEATERP